MRLGRWPRPSVKEILAVIRRTICVTLPCLILAAATVMAQENNMPPEGFAALFNGQDLTGWQGWGNHDPHVVLKMSPEEREQTLAPDMEELKKHWRVENGELINDGQGINSSTIQDFGDIELWIDFKIQPAGDSGIYLRGMPQVQIWDPHEPRFKELGADKGSGGLWNNSPGAPGKDPLVLADNPVGEWNRFHIQQIGDKTTVWLNDKLVVDAAPLEDYQDRSRPIFMKGPIQLQRHDGELRFRNIFVREIPAEEANAWLRRDEQEQGFEPIFNGEDLEGWTGAVSSYEVKDGAIVCKSGQGGTLFTKEEYSDFIVRLEFRLPEGGNNGLAIRYPGSGDPAYTGMCELQVIDNEHEQYAGLDPRQLHGSAYGMVAAHRGYLRPNGEWNYQQVTVEGPKVKVELNGFTILNADLSQVTEYLDDAPHPGKDLTSGHFGFAGHSDPVEFRHVTLKKLTQ